DRSVAIEEGFLDADHTTVHVHVAHVRAQAEVGGDVVVVIVIEEDPVLRPGVLIVGNLEIMAWRRNLVTNLLAGGHRDIDRGGLSYSSCKRRRKGLSDTRTGRRNTLAILHLENDGGVTNERHAKLGLTSNSDGLRHEYRPLELHAA